MIYDLDFKPKALREWTKLRQRLINPKIQSDKLSGYKIKLRSAGFRLAYEVKDDVVVVLVLKAAKRDKFYKNLENII